MAVNQSYAIGWLVERLEWEGTLAELHARAKLANAPEPVVPVSCEQHATAGRGEPRRPPTVRRSPIRGMSLRRAALKIRT